MPTPPRDVLMDLGHVREHVEAALTAGSRPDRDVLTGLLHAIRLLDGIIEDFEPPAPQGG